MEVLDVERKLVIASLAELTSRVPSSSRNGRFTRWLCMWLTHPQLIDLAIRKRDVHFFKKRLQFLPVCSSPVSLPARFALIDLPSELVNFLALKLAVAE